MTRTDLGHRGGGYWSSPWPVECGGNRRQKHTGGRLDAARRSASATTVDNERWNVMMIRRDPGEWYLDGTMPAFVGEPPFGWVRRVDPETLEVIADSGPLPCGDHVWCGSIAAHRDGSLIKVNGSYLHRLSADLEVEVEIELPADRAHNGLLLLEDGSIITKDLRLEGGGRSQVTRLDPVTLELLHAPVELPEPSMGRIASDVTADGEAIYVPGSQHLFRLWVEPDGLRLDHEWQPRYRSPDHGMAWDSCLSGGHAWVMDNGDIEGVRTIFSVVPNGRIESQRSGQLSWQNPAPWIGPQRLLRVDLITGAVDAALPFANDGGGIIAPPVHVPAAGTIVCWDSINGGLAGLDDETLETVWQCDVRATMQPVVFEESGEIVINDFVDRSDSLVVVDASSGDLLDRVEIGSRLANGMFLSPGDDHDVYYCSTLTVARIAWT